MIEEQSQSLEIMTILNELKDLRERVNRLSAQLAALKPVRLRQFKQPAISDIETAEIAVVKPKIARVIVLMSQEGQWLTTLDVDGRAIISLCGTFADVGRQVLDNAPRNLRWEMRYSLSQPPLPQAV